MRPTIALLLALFLLAIAPAHASVANAPGANLEVSLVTYGPGDVYWERFGHDAIELRDTVSGEAVDWLKAALRRIHDNLDKLDTK